MAICDKMYLTKAKSRSLSIEKLSKISDMFEISDLVYRLITYILQTKFASFTDQ